MKWAVRDKFCGVGVGCVAAAGQSDECRARWATAYSRLPITCQQSRRLRRAIDNSTTIDMRLACVSMARRVRNDDYSSATYGS